MASACVLCNNPPSGGIDGRRLTVSLATAGKPNAHAIDRLISGFEHEYGCNNRDEYLWKAYFRSNAKYVTTCNKCSNTTSRKAHQDKNPRQMMNEEAGITAMSMQQTRAVDISSDEEESDDEKVAARFEAVRVTHNSPVGRMMRLWLNSARNKMGGVHLFPKEDAKAYVESYLESLRRLKLRESKQDDVHDADSAGASALPGTHRNITTKKKVGID